MTLAVLHQILTGQLAAGAYQLQQELPGIGDLEVQHTTGADGDGRAGHRLQEVDLLRCAPLDGHLADQVEEVNLTVEGTFCVSGQGVQLFQNGQLLGFQRIAAGTEKIKGLTIPEENRFLAFVDDQLGSQVEVLNGVLPDESLVVAFILDYGSETVLLDFLALDPFCYIVNVVANRTDIGTDTLGGI